MPSPLTTIPSTGLEANLVTQIQQGGGPKISSITYPGNDTAALPAGGQTITISGSGFTNSSVVYIDGTVVGVVSYVNANTLTFVAPAKAASNYSLYVVNADGATAISVPGISFSNAPVWSTSSGSVGSPYEANTFNVSLSATGDGAVTYAMAAGNSLPSGLTLASNGYISGTVPATDPTTTYTFYVDAVDAQNQETTRSFSITYNKDAVTWSSPANGAAYSLSEGTANTIALSASSEAGRSITYTVQSGSLPANVAISGNNITGTPNTIQTNTAVVIRATAANTNRVADRTLYFTIVAGFLARGVFAGWYDFSNWTSTLEYINIATTGNSTDFGNLSTGRRLVGCCGSTTRGLIGGGQPGAPNYAGSSVIDYITFTTTGNATNFGNLTQARGYLASLSSATRGIWAGGTDNNSYFSIIDYVTIASTGNALSFGNLDSQSLLPAGLASSTRGVIHISTTFPHGLSGEMRYITIASTGNTLNFGNLSVVRGRVGSCSSATRGLWAGGYNDSSGLYFNVIDYITIASTGSALDFGDLSANLQHVGGCSSATRGIFAGGEGSSGLARPIQYVTIASLGNTSYFGDLGLANNGNPKQYMVGFSNDHGGVQ